MRLFLRHLFRSIRKRPLQPLIITFTILVTVLVMTVSLATKDSLANELEAINDSKYGNADIVIGLNNESDSRFMFTSDAEEILGERANIVGSYELIFTSLGDKAITGKAVDFYEVEKIFDFSFSQYDKIKEEELKSTAIVTEELMNENSLKLGDTIKLSLFGVEREYKIRAVSSNTLFDTCDVMIDISGVMDALSEKSLFISALGEDFKPYSTLYVDVLNDENVDKAIEELKSSDSLSQRSYIEVSESQNQGFIGLVLPIVISICIVMLSLCGAVIIFSCFFILSKKRILENEAFSTCGAKKSFLNLMQILEVLIYWIIGAPLGILLSIPVSLLINEILSFRYANIQISPLNMLISISVMLFTALVTVCVFIISKDKSVVIKRKTVFLSILSVATLISSIATILSSGNARLPLGFVSAIMMLLCLFFATPCLFSAFSALLVRVMEKKRSGGKEIKAKSLYYALKSSHRVKVLPNLTRVVSVLFAVILSTVFIVGASNGFVEATRESFGGDYLVLNATDNCYEEIKKSSNLESVSKIYQAEIKHQNGFTSQLVSSKDEKSFGKNVELDFLPKENEAVISTAEAKMLELGIGDKMLVSVEGKELELVVVDIINTGSGVIIFDSEYFGLTPNIISVTARTGQEKELLDDLTTASAKELSTVIPANSLQQQQIDRNISLLKCANMLLFVVIAFAFVGFTNNLCESYMSRSEELLLYSYAGVSKIKITKMIFWEIFIMISFGLVVGALGSLIIIPSLDKSLGQLHFEVISFFFRFLGINL